MERGYLGSRIYQEVGNPDALYLEEDWSSEPELKSHIRSSCFTELLLLMETAPEAPVLRCEPSRKHMAWSTSRQSASETTRTRGRVTHPRKSRDRRALVDQPTCAPKGNCAMSSSPQFKRVNGRSRKSNRSVCIACWPSEFSPRTKNLWQRNVRTNAQAKPGSWAEGDRIPNQVQIANRAAELALPTLWWGLLPTHCTPP